MLSQTQIAALAELYEYLADVDARGGIPADQAPFDRQAHYRLAEYCVAFDMDLVPWHRLPPDVLEAKDLKRYRNGEYADYGIDCASTDLRTAVQVKWHGPKTRVTFREACTFKGLSEIVGAERLVLVRTAGSGLSQYVPLLARIEHTEMLESRIVEVCKLARQMFAPAPVAVAAVEPVALSEDSVSYLEELLDGLDLSELSAAVEALSAAAAVDASPATAAVEAPPEAVGTLQLRPYQLEAVERIAAVLGGGGRVATLELPCGSGKTVIIADYIRRGRLSNPASKFAILIPSTLLLRQHCARIAEHCPSLKITCAGGGQLPNKNADVFVAVYNSSHLLQGTPFQAVFVDEAHHMAAEFQAMQFEPDTDEDDAAQEAVAERAYAKVARGLHSEAFVLMSATYPEGIHVDYKYELRQAIDQGYLCDYHVAIPVFGEGAIASEHLAGLVSQHPEWTRVLAYCNSLAEAAAFCQRLKAAGVRSAWFGGDMPLAERQGIVDDFERGVYRALVTVHTLGEGVDIPAADCALFVEPRGSRIDVVQCVGRVLRLCPARGKSLATVVLPTTNERAALERFLRCMTQADPELRRCALASMKGRISMLVADDQLVEAAELLRESMYNRMGILLKCQWERNFELLREYLTARGKYPVDRELYRGTNIGGWISRQKQDKRTGAAWLTKLRIETLEALPGWRWNDDDIRDAQWMATYRDLQAYVLAHKQLPSARNAGSLGIWMNNHKVTLRTSGAIDDITLTRKALLESLPGWNWGNDDKWEQTYQRVVAYEQEHGKLPPTTGKHKVPILSNWLASQKAALKVARDAGKPIPARLQKLQALPGFGKTREISWLDNYALLTEYIEVHGRFPPEKDGMYRDENLGNWVANVRRSFQNPPVKIPEAEMNTRKELMAALPGWRW